MKLKRVISGGQSGADKTALILARMIGLETGGTAPKGWKTENGADVELEGFGLRQSRSSDYAVRTRENVQDADATLWFGVTDSPGYWCTKNAATTKGKPFYVNPYGIQLQYIVNSYTVVNVAGNRMSKNRHVQGIVEQAFTKIANLLGKAAPNLSAHPKDGDDVADNSDFPKGV